MRVLAIESTCDETAASVVESFGEGVKVITNEIASSATMHQKYGGIVPEVAAREQINSIIPVISEAIKDIDIASIDAVAVSYGPGLMGSLLVGVETAKVLSEVWEKPLIKVNHMEAHIAANWIIEDGLMKLSAPVPTLPAIGLVVSGGHTDIILLRSFSNKQWVGGTRDDAVGEAFDKAARLLGLPYPGGPSIQKAIDSLSVTNKGGFVLPRPMIHEDSLEMSFSGLKAALSKVVGQTEMSDENTKLLAKELNEAVVDVLVRKTMLAMEKYQINTLILAGGVAANKMLREGFASTVDKSHLFIPELKYCGDNAAMVGAAAILNQDVTNNATLFPNPSLMTV